MELIQSGQKISLNIIKQDNSLVEIIGTISEVFDDRLIVELPPYFMRYIEYLDVNCPFTAKVFSKMGTIDFNSVVISSPLEEGHLVIELDVNALKLTPSSELPMVNAIEPLIIKHKDENINATTFELSTDYIKFNSDTPLNIGESFDCELKLNCGTINFKATVTENDVVYDTEYTATVFSMNEQDRETLLYYMYTYANENPEEKAPEDKQE